MSCQTPSLVLGAEGGDLMISIVVVVVAAAAAVVVVVTTGMFVNYDTTIMTMIIMSNRVILFAAVTITIITRSLTVV